MDVELPEPQELARLASVEVVQDLRNRLLKMRGKMAGFARWLAVRLTPSAGGVGLPNEHADATGRLGEYGVLDVRVGALDATLTKVLDKAII
jgi:hypothetical protein